MLIYTSYRGYCYWAYCQKWAAETALLGRQTCRSQNQCCLFLRYLLVMLVWWDRLQEVHTESLGSGGDKWKSTSATKIWWGRTGPDGASIHSGSWEPGDLPSPHVVLGGGAAGIATLAQLMKICKWHARTGWELRDLSPCTWRWYVIAGESLGLWGDKCLLRADTETAPGHSSGAGRKPLWGSACWIVCYHSASLKK